MTSPHPARHDFRGRFPVSSEHDAAADYLRGVAEQFHEVTR
jgi:hypothetical protein